mmetsp:Transcript_41392/g.128664  ORF Transcript_41392/g.128664 Transcript_41392/m.128664 type:complete len:302 (-) Transcript_41392:842-1747(-)
MSFAHLWYSCSSSRKARRGTVAAPPPKPTSSCAAFRPWSLILRTNAISTLAGTSGFPLLSFAKSSSAFRPSRQACARRAAATASSASRVTCFLAFFRASPCLLHLESKAPTFTFSFTNCALASLLAPFVDVFISSMRSLIPACAFWMAWKAASRPSSALSMASSGFSSSAPRSATSFSTAGSAASTALALAAMSASQSAIMADAALFSAASARFFRSTSTSSVIRFSKSITFFFSCVCVYCTLLTRGLNLASCDFVSARGPARTCFSSSVFCSKYLPASLAASATWCRARSACLCSATCGE